MERNFVLVLDLKTFGVPADGQGRNLPALEMAKNAATVQERLQAAARQRSCERQSRERSYGRCSHAVELCGGSHRRSRPDDAPSIDRAMRAGFNWELGPFEMWDAAGVKETVARMKALNLPVSRAVEELLATEYGSWYSTDGPQCFNPTSGAWEPIPQQPGHARVRGFPTHATGWFAAMPGRHWWISAMGSAASNCTR